MSFNNLERFIMNIRKYFAFTLSFICLNPFAQINYDQLTADEKGLSRIICDSFRGVKEAAEKRFNDFLPIYPEHYFNEEFKKPFEQYLQEDLLQQQLSKIHQSPGADRYKARANQLVQNIFNHFIKEFTTEIQSSASYESGMKNAIAEKFPDYFSPDFDPMKHDLESVKLDDALLSQQEATKLFFNDRINLKSETFKSDIYLAVAILFGDQEVTSSGKKMPINQNVFDFWTSNLPAALQLQVVPPAQEPAQAAAATAGPVANDAELARQELAELIANFQTAGISNEEIIDNVSAEQKALAREILGPKPAASAARPVYHPHNRREESAAAAAPQAAAAARPATTPVMPTANAQLLNELIADSETLISVIQAAHESGKTIDGYNVKKEAIMDYGSDNEACPINRAFRARLSSAINDEIKSYPGFPEVQYQYVPEQNVHFYVTSLYKRMGMKNTEDHIKFYNVIEDIKLKEDSEGFRNLNIAINNGHNYVRYLEKHNKIEKAKHLFGLIHMYALDQYKTPENPRAMGRNCGLGADGRAFLINLEIIKAMAGK
ncbi:MAG: hypothetical protein CMM87_02770 [Rickettsiales bacterium]|nr:hypothetical protein [Rickettsiales bacterium]|tara:strand:+ start:2475 stop:4121 length:1647 start_codon:yes stop_codon:yes gene_type:complete